MNYNKVLFGWEHIKDCAHTDGLEVWTCSFAESKEYYYPKTPAIIIELRYVEMEKKHIYEVQFMHIARAWSSFDTLDAAKEHANNQILTMGYKFLPMHMKVLL